jgi:hypothetical protein
MKINDPEISVACYKNSLLFLQIYLHLCHHLFSMGSRLKVHIYVCTGAFLMKDERILQNQERNISLNG